MACGFSMILFYPYILLNFKKKSKVFSPISCLGIKINQALPSVCSDYLYLIYFDIILHLKLKSTASKFRH